jgi:hypothetical protein
MHLANNRELGNDAAVAPKEAAGAPACEIEITEEMIEAALTELCAFDPENGNERLVAKEIIKAPLATKFAVGQTGDYQRRNYAFY